VRINFPIQMDSDWLPRFVLPGLQVDTSGRNQDPKDHFNLYFKIK
jgi:hypothetical protein